MNGIIQDNNPKDCIYHIPPDNNVKLIVENGRVKELVINDKEKEHPQRIISTTERQADSIRLKDRHPNGFTQEIEFDTGLFEVELTKGDVPHIW